MQGQNEAQLMDRYGDFDNGRSTNLTTRSLNVKGGKGSASKAKPSMGPVDPFAPAAGAMPSTNAEPDPFAPALPRPTAKPKQHELKKSEQSLCLEKVCFYVTLL